MSKDKTTNEEVPTTPEEAVAPEAPKKPQAVIKVVAIELDTEYTEPDGWVLKEIHSVDVAEGKFFGVLVKILDYPTPKVRLGKEFEIPQE
jgi:hypothetical protein